MSVPADASLDRPDPVVVRIAGLLRPEFTTTVIYPDPDDPVLAGRRCAVGDCERPSRSKGLCAAHHHRWLGQGSPEVAAFIASAAPVRATGHRFRAEEVFDLSTLVALLGFLWVPGPLRVPVFPYATRAIRRERAPRDLYTSGGAAEGRSRGGAAEAGHVWPADP